MFGNYLPDRENTRGSRWNPPEIAAIYTSFSEAGALAEAEHQLAVQPLRPRIKRTLYEIELTLASVVDLSAPGVLAALPFDEAEISNDDHSRCRELGGAAAWLEYDGIIVPSARSEVPNLVIFPANRAPTAVFEVRSQRPVDE